MLLLHTNSILIWKGDDFGFVFVIFPNKRPTFPKFYLKAQWNAYFQHIFIYLINFKPKKPQSNANPSRIKFQRNRTWRTQKYYFAVKISYIMEHFVMNREKISSEQNFSLPKIKTSRLVNCIFFFVFTLSFSLDPLISIRGPQIQTNAITIKLKINEAFPFGSISGSAKTNENTQDKNDCYLSNKFERKMSITHKRSKYIYIHIHTTHTSDENEM